MNIHLPTKEDEVLLEQYQSPRPVLFRKQNSKIKLFLSMILIAAFILTGDIIWKHLNHTKLGPIVELDVGKIQGITITESNIDADYFLGIPFAEPPIGKNRFEKTVPIKPWPDVKYTIKPKPHCSPLRMEGSSFAYSEDCLYMNIVRPHKKTDKKLPVLFVIHGGAFEMGGADVYGVSASRGLSLLKHDVILVAVEYRLAVFGFASTGNKELPGNLGYFDQAEALKFVHRNIHAFGGDPNKITILGCSAGGASVTALSISPYTRDYVYQAVAMSGSAFSAWATSDVVIDNTRDLIEVIGRKPEETIKERLKRATQKEIYDAIEIIGTTEFGQNFGKFIPRIDGDFFPKDLPDLIQDSPPKSIIIGLTQEESLAWTLIPSRNGTCGADVIPDEKIPGFSEKDLEGLIRGHLVIDKFYKNETKNVQDRVLEFYSKSNSTNRDNVFYLQRYTQTLSDLQFNIPILWEILLRGFHNWKVYAYHSPYFNETIISSRCPVKESYHGTDQHYANLILDGENDNESGDDYKMEKVMISWLINFVKTGNPSIPELEWKPATRMSALQYANLLPNPQLKDGLLLDRARFWTKLTQDYNYDLVRMMPKKRNSKILI